ncbi:hypothetical protein [Ammoniphilus sp. 3BR4]|uniref:hypothetical protein n=1 Tax=Ammoniphilus sp. 3BR4 TaxID=3158265 RepID=UPI0034677264
MTFGRISHVAKHTAVPRDDVHQPDCQHGEVVSYQLNQEELAKYRAMPMDSERWSVFKIPMRGKKA